MALIASQAPSSIFENRSKPYNYIAMSHGEALQDDEVAALLERDARGLTASKRRSDAPRPNLRFLNNILNDTKSHNAALLARDAAESRHRLQSLSRDKRSGEKRSNEDELKYSPSLKKRKQGDRPDRWVSAFGGLGESEGKVIREKRRELKAQTDDRLHRPRSGSRERRREDKRSDGTRRHAKHRSGRHKRSRSLDDSHRKKKRRREHSGSRSASPSRAHHSKQARSANKSAKSPATPPPTSPDKPSRDDSDSDPLEAIVGPAPPPKVQPRGRGAHKSSSGMDLRFNDPAYDPKNDVRLEADDETDDWDMALEALKDRRRWRQQGASRLREAGFSEEDVSKWEKSAAFPQQERGKMDVSDVRWRRKGEGREWDDGKVVDSEGDVDIEAGFGRLKDS